MSYLYETVNEQGILLYAQENQVFLRHKNKHQFLQPILLTSDYLNGLKETIFNSTIYFTYINTSQDIMIRSLFENVFPYILSAKNDTVYYMPELISFHGKLLLMYYEFNQNTKSYLLHCLLPYEQEHEILITNTPALSKPIYKIIVQQNYIIINIHSDNEIQTYILDSEFTARELSIDAKKPEDFDQILNHTLETLKERNKEMETMVLEKEKLTKELEKLQKDLMEKEKIINYQKGQIQSAITQYNALMEIAEQYKQEAIKWSSHFHI